MIKRAVLLVFSVLLLAAVVAGSWLIRETERELHRAAPFQTALEYRLEPGTNALQAAHDLHAEGLIRHPWLLMLAAVWRDQTHRLQAGEYRFLPGTTPAEILDQLVQGKVTQYSITIIEGWTFADLLDAVLSHARLIPSLANREETEIMELLNRSGQPAEGMFYPDTYQFPAGTYDLQILRMAENAMHQVIRKEWAGRAEGLPYRSPYEAIIMASIVEKEAQLDEERPRIAGVFLRRLELGMRLQADPTVRYSLGPDFRSKLNRRHLQVDSPFNTYLHAGLPPAPISLPSRASIHAALHPRQEKVLYFVAKGDGSHYFSKTLEEHNAYRKKIRNFNRL